MKPSAPTYTLDQLLALEAIDREGTFAKAARALNRVPSAMSHAVRSLEAHLDVELFDRSGHRAVLTPAGRRLLEEAQAVLGQARRLDQVARTLKDGWEPTLAVVVDGVYPTEPVMRALRAFNAHQAPTRVVIHVEYQSGVAARFERDGMDVMLMLEFDGTGRWHAEPMPPLEMVLVAAAEHRLAHAPVAREHLAAHVELVVRDSAPEFAETPRESWFGSQHVAWLSDFHSKLIAIRTGAGYGWLPRWLAAPHLSAGDLVVVPFAEGNRWTYHPHVIHRRDLPLGRAGRLFLEALRQEIAQAAHLFI